MTMTIHIAGPVINRRQDCARCGASLVDFRDKEVMVAGGGSLDLSFWAEGSFVGKSAGCSVLMGRDAEESDEIPCGRAQ